MHLHTTAGRGHRRRVCGARVLVVGHVHVAAGAAPAVVVGRRTRRSATTPTAVADDRSRTATPAVGIVDGTHGRSSRGRTPAIVSGVVAACVGHGGVAAQAADVGVGRAAPAAVGAIAAAAITSAATIASATSITALLLRAVPGLGKSDQPIRENAQCGRARCSCRKGHLHRLHHHSHLAFEDSHETGEVSFRSFSDAYNVARLVAVVARASATTLLVRAITRQHVRSWLDGETHHVPLLPATKAPAAATLGTVTTLRAQ